MSSPTVAATAREDVTFDDGTRGPTTLVTIAVPDNGAAGLVWRLPDGRLAVLTLADVAEGAEDTVKATVQAQILGSGTVVLAGDMRTLGVDDGLQAWAEED